MHRESPGTPMLNSVNITVPINSIKVKISFGAAQDQCPRENTNGHLHLAIWKYCPIRIIGSWNGFIRGWNHLFATSKANAFSKQQSWCFASIFKRCGESYVCAGCLDNWIFFKSYPCSFVELVRLPGLLKFFLHHFAFTVERAPLFNSEPSINDGGTYSNGFDLIVPFLKKSRDCATVLLLIGCFFVWGRWRRDTRRWLSLVTGAFCVAGPVWLLSLS